MILNNLLPDLFEKKSAYAYPDQAIDQAESLNSLSADIYSENKRFIYELIQNADDSASDGQLVKVRIKILPNYIVISHSGNPFSERDVVGICGVANGTKKNDATKTGYKGIGFKSVFGKSDKVVIVTGEEAFKFDKAATGQLWREEWGNMVQWQKENDREFVMPWQIIPLETSVSELPDGLNHTEVYKGYNVSTIIELEDTDGFEEDLQELLENVQVLLFLRNVSEIEVEGENIYKLKKEIKRNPCNDGEKAEVKLVNHNGNSSDWLLRTYRFDIPEEARKELRKDEKSPRKLQFAERAELSFAAQLDGKEGFKAFNAEESILFTYLPTKVSKFYFPFLLNSNFLTDASRESLHEDRPWNIFLFSQTARYLLNWLGELSALPELKPYILQLLPDKYYSDNDRLKTSFNEGYEEALKQINFIPSENGKLLKAAEAAVDLIGLHKETFIKEKWLLKFLKKRDDKKKPLIFASLLKKAGRLKAIGASLFSDNDLADFFSSDLFVDNHAIRDNPHLIAYLKCLSEKQEDVFVKLSEIPFLLNQDGDLCTPKVIYLNALEDAEIEVDFLHPEVYRRISDDEKTVEWLKKLDVQEGSELVFIRKTILGNAKSSITSKTALVYTRRLFRAWKKGDIVDNELSDTKYFKVLTKKETLKPADACFLSNLYLPTHEVEDYLNVNIFLSDDYTQGTEVKLWRSFFVLLGVHEKIIVREIRISKEGSKEICNSYFDEVASIAKKGHPYPHLISSSNYVRVELPLLFQYLNKDFAPYFWKIFFTTNNPERIQWQGRMSWGYFGSNEGVENYVPWALRNLNVLSATDGKCYKRSDIFLPSEQNLALAGDHLPILNYDGELSSDWLSFLSLRETFELENYLNILHSISGRYSGQEVPQEEVERIYLLYAVIAEQFRQFGSGMNGQLQDWVSGCELLADDGEFYSSGELTIVTAALKSEFKGYKTLKLNRELAINDDFINLAKALGVRVIAEDQFEVKLDNKQPEEELLSVINRRLPFLSIVYAGYKGEPYSKAKEKLIRRIQKVEVLKGDQLRLELDGVLLKSPRVYKKADTLYISGSWNNHLTMATLPENLADLLWMKSASSAIHIIVSCTVDEVLEWLAAEGISTEDALFLEDADKVAEEEKQVSKHSNSGKGDMVHVNDISTNILAKYGFSSIEELDSFINRQQAYIDFENEENGGKVDSRHLGSSHRNEANREAYNLITPLLLDEGYRFTLPYIGSVVSGVYKDGLEVPMVIKSYRNSSFKFNITPGEWEQLTKPNAVFLVYRGGNTFEKLTLETLLAENLRFHMEFMTQAFSSRIQMAQFAAMFKRVRGVRFQIDAPAFMQISSFDDILFDKSNEMQKAMPETDELLK